MSDAETKFAIMDVIKERCALRTVLTKKPCPYFGVSASCLDCTYDWVTIAASVRKVAEKRRAAYEQERENNKILMEKLVECQRMTATLKGIALPFINSIMMAQRYIDEVNNAKVEEPFEAEGKDVGQDESESSASEKG